MTKSHLKLVKCHRGKHRLIFTKMIRDFPHEYRKILKGPLKGCFRLVNVYEGMRRSVYRVHKDFVLEFVVVIRVDLDAK